MKWMIASDLHGSALWTERLLGAYRAEGADRLLLLGDILYHGPRNDLPEGYAPKKVIELLSPLAPSIFSVRGNCEAEVDQMVLPFPVLAEYCLLEHAGHLICAVHGHLDPPPLHPGDVLLQGHTHIPMCEEMENGVLHLNPGSVSIPKNSTPHSYMLLEDGTFYWRSLETGKCYHRFTLS